MTCYYTSTGVRLYLVEMTLDNTQVEPNVTDLMGGTAIIVYGGNHTIFVHVTSIYYKSYQCRNFNALQLTSRMH